MSSSDSWKLLVFRDGKTVHNTRELLNQLSRQIERLNSLFDFTSSSAQEELVETLLRAGELECGLADELDFQYPAEVLANLTDSFAAALVSKTPLQLSSTQAKLSDLHVPEQVTLSPPEGFCYYALHPLDYVDLLDRSNIKPSAAAIIGIRSIGTTLSAVVTAWFKSRGIPADRITARPIGHPFDRVLVCDSRQSSWIASQLQAGAKFFIVDEGPGLSGSSFLCVAEALESAGVPRESITLMPSSASNLEKLIAPNAAERWARYKTLALSPTIRIPRDAARDISYGEWRKHVFNSEQQWPAVWAWTERKKYLSADGTRFFRFDGHGHYGKLVRKRSEVLAEHGWGPEVSVAGNGFTDLPWLSGDRPSRADRDTLIQLARYCAFRAKHFAQNATDRESLEEMTRLNLERALGVTADISLPIERPVIADARMMPYEWIYLAGRLQKLDASSHGDDHFYPGPTDIAWDLAGMIIEWKLEKEEISFLIFEYQQNASDEIGGRLNDYLVAYCLFRIASMTAARTTADEPERSRIESELSFYRAEALSLLKFLNRSLACNRF